ncbi:MAG: CDP-alcohol phosphatidyltransferase family protein [Coprococcus sp.]|nr:CDP-alcohol phosphatidyltransferase family protein [Coprococcus sp.]
MIGFFNYTVILTYISLASSVIGILFTNSPEDVSIGIFCLAFSGLLDAFDGRIARTKTDRTLDEKRYGVQIDSLCDIVCFGVLPVIICWHSGMNTIHGCIILVLYCLAGLIRLAYYNVLEEGKMTESDTKAENGKKYFHGMPITSIAIGLPVIYLSSPLFKHYFIYVLEFIMLLAAILFVINFKFAKPTTKQLIIIIIIVAVAVLSLKYCFNWKQFVHWSFGGLLTIFRKG